MACVCHSASLPQITLDLSAVHKIVDKIETYSPGTSPKIHEGPSPRTTSINKNKYLSTLRIWDKELVVYHTEEKEVIKDCFRLRSKTNLVQNKFTPLDDEEYFDKTNKYLVCVIRKLKKGNYVNDYENLIKRKSSQIPRRKRSNSNPLAQKDFLEENKSSSFDKKGYKVLGFILYRKNCSRKIARILDIVFIKDPEYLRQKFPEIQNFPLTTHSVTYLENFLKNVNYTCIFRAHIKSPRLNSLINDF